MTSEGAGELMPWVAGPSSTTTTPFPLVSVGALAPEFLIDQTCAIVHHTSRIHAALALLSVPSQQRVITDQVQRHG